MCSFLSISSWDLFLNILRELFFSYSSLLLDRAFATSWSFRHFLELPPLLGASATSWSFCWDLASGGGSSLTRPLLRRALGSDKWYTRRIRVQLVRSLASPHWCLEDRSGPGGSILHTCSAFRRRSTSISREVRTGKAGPACSRARHFINKHAGTIPFLPPHRAKFQQHAP